MDELEQPAEQLDSDAAAAAAEEHDQQAEQHDAQADEVSQEDAEEDEEIEIGGKKVAMPKSIAAEIKAGTMRQADYTQKTQTVAEERRTVEAERARVREEAQQHQQYLDDVAEKRAIEKQLKQFAELDWNGLIETDPVRAMQLQQSQRALQDEHAKLDKNIAQKQHDNALAEQQEFAKQAQEAEAYVQREIPGWTQERANAVNQFALAQGLKLDQSMAKLIIQQPALIKLFDQAEKFHQLVKKQATKPAAPAAPPPPVQRVGATRAAAKVDPDKMTTEQWMKHRSEQLRKR